MITGQAQAALLHAIATGHSDRALNIVTTEPDVSDDIRKQMYNAISENAKPADQARAIGDVLLARDADQFLINECYRCAFYLSSDWSDMSENPLYAYFMANRASAVLDKWVHYFPIYARHLARYRDRPVKVLEVGVYRGGGLQMWQKYLGESASLVGLDVDEAAVRSVQGRFPVVLGDQEDPEVLRKLNDDCGPFDVIIDDGGHTMAQQIATIETLFPLLNDGGTFIVEDCHTSYWPTFGGALHGEGSFIEWTKDRIDDLHARHDAQIDPRTVWATHVDGLHVYDSVVVLDKKLRFRPFNEMSGSASFLYADRFSEGLGVEFLATRDQALADVERLKDQLQQLQTEETDPERAERLRKAWATEEELRLARAELQRARSQGVELGGRLHDQALQLDRTRGELLDSWQHVQDIRRTSSWRATAPIRAVRRLLSR